MAALDAALPVGMQLVSALDDAETLSPPGSSSSASEHVRRALLLPLEGANALDVEMDIDVDVFRPSAMLGADAFEDGELFGSSFQPADLGDAEADIEQMLLCGSEYGGHGHHNHQHQTAPGQGCQCRNFAILANRVHTKEKGVTSDAAKHRKKVLHHTFGSGSRLQGFDFGEGAVQDPLQQQDVEMDGRVTPIPDEVTVKQQQITQVVPATPERIQPRTVKEETVFSTPQREYPSHIMSSPVSTSFISLESISTPLSTISRSTANAEAPVMVRSLSPADELEKMAGGGAKTTTPKMNMLRGNFQVSPGHDSVPLVKPTPALPPPYLRGALESPEKRRAHSKTFNSFAQSLSFSFPNESAAKM